MKSKDKLINQVMDGFQNNRGKASTYCFNKTVIPELIYTLITKIIMKRRDATIFMVVDGYETRRSIIDFLRDKPIYLENAHHIKCLSIDFVKDRYAYPYTITITIGVNDNYDIIRKLTHESQFTLAILTENVMDSKFITKVRSILPCIDTADLDVAIRNDSIYSPVEETWRGVEISAEDRETYDEYTKYINTSVSIFGSLETVEQCRVGDMSTNTSAADIRERIAKNNGWREDLDMNVAFMKEIDNIYNPEALKVRANNFYNITKLRRDLVTDNDAKLYEILRICTENKGKRILIISKRGEFAAKVTKYINQNTPEDDNIQCGDYHDCIEDKVAVDEHGEVVLIKTGVNAGKPRILGSQAISSLNMKRFNERMINILSIKSASNTKLKIACDVVIITSPLCDGIIDVKKRFANVVFNGVPTIVYKVYCFGTVENEKMTKEKTNNIIKVIDDSTVDVSYEEDTGCIIL